MSDPESGTVWSKFRLWHQGADLSRTEVVAEKNSEALGGEPDLRPGQGEGMYPRGDSMGPPLQNGETYVLEVSVVTAATLF